MIQLKNVCKILNSRLILNHINYIFDYGSVYGICGPNGSGKTMLLRAMAGLIIPEEGEILVDGKILHKDITVTPNVGIMIENMELLSQYNAFDNLKILSKIKKTANDNDIVNVLKRVGLSSELKVKKYSLGMKQRLNIAQAIFERQQIILLDEPTNALDKEGINLFRTIVKEEKEKGALIIIATHHKEDVEEMCDKILTVSEGELYENADF